MSGRPGPSPQCAADHPGEVVDSWAGPSDWQPCFVPRGPSTQVSPLRCARRPAAGPGRVGWRGDRRHGVDCRAGRPPTMEGRAEPDRSARGTSADGRAHPRVETLRAGSATNTLAVRMHDPKRRYWPTGWSCSGPNGDGMPAELAEGPDASSELPAPCRSRPPPGRCPPPGRQPPPGPWLPPGRCPPPGRQPPPGPWLPSGRCPPPGGQPPPSPRTCGCAGSPGCPVGDPPPA
jgi:hypothetical protein